MDNFAYLRKDIIKKTGYSTSCTKCNNPMSSVLKGGFSDKPVKNCVLCGDFFKSIKMQVGIDDKPLYNEDGRGYGFDYVNSKGITVEGIYPPIKIYIMICKKCNKSFQYTYGLKYDIVNGKPQSNMDGNYYGVPCNCGYWN